MCSHKAECHIGLTSFLPLFRAFVSFSSSLVTDSRGCEHEGTKVETASNRLNGVADPEGATLLTTFYIAFRDRIQDAELWQFPTRTYLKQHETQNFQVQM